MKNVAAIYPIAGKTPLTWGLVQKIQFLNSLEFFYIETIKLFIHYLVSNDTTYSTHPFHYKINIEGTHEFN